VGKKYEKWDEKRKKHKKETGRSKLKDKIYLLSVIWKTTG
jgi:hypothetical protein